MPGHQAAHPRAVVSCGSWRAAGQARRRRRSRPPLRGGNRMLVQLVAVGRRHGRPGGCRTSPRRPGAGPDAARRRRKPVPAARLSRRPAHCARRPGVVGARRRPTWATPRSSPLTPPKVPRPAGTRQPNSWPIRPSPRSRWPPSRPATTSTPSPRSLTSAPRGWRIAPAPSPMSQMWPRSRPAWRCPLTERPGLARQLSPRVVSPRSFGRRWRDPRQTDTPKLWQPSAAAGLSGTSAPPQGTRATLPSCSQCVTRTPATMTTWPPPGQRLTSTAAW